MDLVYILLTVLVIWGGIAVITPGPNFFITAHTAVGDSRLSAFFIVLGITVGTMIWAICGYLGINILFKTAPWLFLTLKLAGGCYLIYLGIRLLFSKNKNTKTVTTIKNSNIKNFRAGVLTNLSNPKTAAFVTSLFATAMPQKTPLVYGITSILLMCLISLLWYSSVVLIFSQQRFKSIYQHSETAIKKNCRHYIHYLRDKAGNIEIKKRGGASFDTPPL